MSQEPGDVRSARSCAAMAAQAGAGARGWALDRDAIAAAMVASSPPPEGELEAQQRRHSVTRRSPDHQARRREMAQTMGAGRPHPHARPRLRHRCQDSLHRRRSRHHHYHCDHPRRAALHAAGVGGGGEGGGPLQSAISALRSRPWLPKAAVAAITVVTLVHDK